MITSLQCDFNSSSCKNNGVSGSVVSAPNND